MSQSANDRQRAYRQRQKELGRRPRILYLTDEEYEQVKQLLRRMRLNNHSTGEKR